MSQSPIRVGSLLNVTCTLVVCFGVYARFSEGGMRLPGRVIIASHLPGPSRRNAHRTLKRRVTRALLCPAAHWNTGSSLRAPSPVVGPHRARLEMGVASRIRYPHRCAFSKLGGSLAIGARTVLAARLGVALFAAARAHWQPVGPFPLTGLPLSGSHGAGSRRTETRKDSPGPSASFL